MHGRTWKWTGTLRHGTSVMVCRHDHEVQSHSFNSQPSSANVTKYLQTLHSSHASVLTLSSSPSPKKYRLQYVVGFNYYVTACFTIYVFHMFTSRKLQPNQWTPNLEIKQFQTNYRCWDVTQCDSHPFLCCWCHLENTIKYAVTAVDCRTTKNKKASIR